MSNRGYISNSLVYIVYVVVFNQQPQAQDEGGTGEDAGALDEWGFAVDASALAPAPARKQKLIEPPGDMECDSALVLNHIGGAVGDRQSSRHGSRRKNRSSNGKKHKGTVCIFMQ